MQVNRISNQNFNARLAGDYGAIMYAAVEKGFPKAKAKQMLKNLERMADDVVITFQKPQEGTVTGRVTLEVENKPSLFKRSHSGVDMEIRPVQMDDKEVLSQYVKATNLLAKTDFRRNNGTITIA